MSGRHHFLGLLTAATLVVVTSSSALGAEAPAEFRPRVDHHQHLLSPQAAASLYLPTAPKDLPAGVVSLLKKRVAAWNDAEALQSVYAGDATLLDMNEGNWIQGRQEVAARESTTFGSPYDITPVAFARTSDGGRLFGFYTRGQGETLVKRGYVTLDLQQTPGGWLIRSEQSLFPGPSPTEPIDAEKLIAELDKAGIDKAVVLSVGYWFQEQEAVGDPKRAQREDQWTAEQAARYPTRLVAFCSLNPLHPGASASLEQCVKDKRFKGIKLHFGSSDLDTTAKPHRAKLRWVLGEANKAALPVVIHTRGGPDYGAAHVRALLEDLSSAPDVPVQIAHLWGGGAFSEDALAAFATAVKEGHPATKNLYFDVTDTALNAATDEQLSQVATAIRTIGLDKVFYGSDMMIQGHPDPAESAKAFRERVPLEEHEFRAIAENTAPYLK